MREPQGEAGRTQADEMMRLAHLPQEQLPVGVVVTKGKTPAGGAFTVALLRDEGGVPCPKDKAVVMDLYECDYRGNILFHTQMSRRRENSPTE